MVSTPPKRAASRTPDGRPSKKVAPSSPEEGELDSDVGGSPPPSKPRSPTPTPSAVEPAAKKVAFPFKSKAKSMQDDGPPQTSVNGSRKVVYERPDDLDRRLRDEEGPSTHAYERRRRPQGRDNWGTRDRFIRSPNRYPPRRDAHWSSNSYQPGSNSYYPEGDRSRRQEHVPLHYPAADERYPARDRGYDREPDGVRGRDRSRTPPTRSPTRSVTGRSPSPSSSTKEKHRLPAPRTPTSGFSPPSDTRRQELEPDRERDVGRDRRGGRQPKRGDFYAPGDYDRRYERGWDRDPGGHYRREADAYEAWTYQDPYAYERDRRDFDDRYDRRDRYDYQREGYADTYRPLSPQNHYDRQPSTPRPPPPASMDPRASPRPPAEAAPPPPLLGDRRKDQTLPPEHATISIAVPKREQPQPEEPSHDHPAAEPSKLRDDAGDKPSALPRRRRMPVQRTREEEKTMYGRVFEGCGKQSDYELMTKVGEGTFGEVHKAMHRTKGHIVALKRILMHNEKEGMPVTALREIKILKALNHPCILHIIDMFVVRSTKDSPLSIYMVFPYMDHDLAGLLENERVKLSPSQIKLYMKQLLEGTEYMHRNRILHRDMKAANLLISNSGSLQIADFGLARAFDPTIVREPKGRDGRERKYTNCVVTRWYRPPELLLGARQYGGEVDIWGIGCVLGEMFMRRPILPGTSDLDQLDKIWQLCGTPNQQTWPNHDALPGCDGVKRFGIYPRRIKTVYDQIGPETNDLLDKLLTCNPAQRITAAQALDHDYFWTDPLPADPKSLPQYEPSHELDKRSRRQHAGPPPDANFGPPRPPPPPPAVVPPPSIQTLPAIWYPRNGPPPPPHGAPPPQGLTYQGSQPGYGAQPGGYGTAPPPQLHAQGPPRSYGGGPGGHPPRPPMARGTALPPQSGGLNYG